jgi:putative ABC transport system ATP-binding protein
MIKVKNLFFSYPRGDFSLRVPTFQVSAGESVAITGPSGSGKTTLLKLIAGILKAKSGEISVGEYEVSRLKERALRQYRVNHIGMVSQSLELLEYLNVRDNILLPYRLGAKRPGDLDKRVHRVVTSFKIESKLKCYPSEISQGERQRVALSRALVTKAKLIVADEPTGSLDDLNTKEVGDMLLEYVKAKQVSLVIVTHDHHFASRFDRTIDFGKLLG